jgi:hypothetical protein
VPDNLANILNVGRDLEDRRTKLFIVLDGEDDLGVVIRAHIHLEHELKEYIAAVVPKSKNIKFSDFDYNGLVALAFAVGLKEEWKTAFLSIGTLRNRFAHRLDMKLTKQEANNFYNSLSKDLQSSVHQGHAHLRKQPQYAGEPKSVKHLSPIKLFGSCVVTVLAALQFEILGVHLRNSGILEEARKAVEKGDITGTETPSLIWPSRESEGR